MSSPAPIHPAHAWILGLVIDDDEPEVTTASARSDERASGEDGSSQRAAHADHPPAHTGAGR